MSRQNEQQKLTKGLGTHPQRTKLPYNDRKGSASLGYGRLPPEAARQAKATSTTEARRRPIIIAEDPPPAPKKNDKKTQKKVYVRTADRRRLICNAETRADR